MYDCLIKNAYVIDGTGAPAFQADIALKNGKIARVAQNLQDDCFVIDAAGLTVTPGFIDSHSHSDGVMLTAPDQLEKIEQGITLSVGGQCGATAAPMDKDPTADMLRDLPGFGKKADVYKTMGTLLDLKPVITETKEGKLVSSDKVRGRKSALRLIVDKAVENIDDPKNAMVTIIHADAPEDAARVVEAAAWIADEVSERFVNSKNRVWIGVGGTFTTSAALVQGIPWQQREKIHGFVLTVESVEKAMSELAEMPIEKRLQLESMQPQRADIVVHGMAILLACMKKLNISEITVSEYGNLEGYLKQKYLF